MRATVKWNEPIEEAPEGRRLLLWLEGGERGSGEIAVGMVFKNDKGRVDCYWTWGGPNSGSDIDERPTMWALLPYAPDGLEHD
jgi:hypothetical protein